MANYYTKLASGTASFDHMMKNGFGVVTVMNAHVYDALSLTDYKANTAYAIAKAYGEGGSQAENALCVLDTLKVANITMEGPSKTISGGRYSNPLIKFGKSARLEMQDALGKGNAIEALCGGIIEQSTNSAGNIVGLHAGEDFTGPKLIVGDSFFIDRDSGEQVKVRIIFYQFLPDSIFNLTQDAEGDATVFDMNGDLLTTEILVGCADPAASDTNTHGVFYSIVDESVTPGVALLRNFANDTEVAAAARELFVGQKIKVDGKEKTIKTIVLAKIDAQGKPVDGPTGKNQVTYEP